MEPERRQERSALPSGRICCLLASFGSTRILLGRDLFQLQHSHNHNQTSKPQEPLVFDFFDRAPEGSPARSLW